jgi:hypothetical protein
MAAAINTFIALIYIGFSGYFLSYYKIFNINKLYNPISMISLIIISTIAVYLLKDSMMIYKTIISTIILIVLLRYLFYKFKRVNFQLIDDLV